MVSVIVSWRDRVELGRALPSLVAAARALSGDVTIVNFDGSADLLAEQLGSLAREVVVVHVANQRYFNKSAAQNVGAGHSRHDLLFFCDCDILLDETQLRELIDRVMARDDTFGTVAGVRESEINSRGGRHVACFGYQLRIRTADGRVLQIDDNEEDAENGTRQAPGLLLVRRRDFERVNGYNGRFLGWGWEDQDMIGRLTLGAGLTRIMHGTVTHLSHDDRARVQHYPVASRWESRDRMFREALANYDDANFLGTFREDLARLPIRVDAASAMPV